MDRERLRMLIAIFLPLCTMELQFFTCGETVQASRDLDTGIPRLLSAFGEMLTSYMGFATEG